MINILESLLQHECRHVVYCFLKYTRIGINEGKRLIKVCLAIHIDSKKNDQKQTNTQTTNKCY